MRLLQWAALRRDREHVQWTNFPIQQPKIKEDNVQMSFTYVEYYQNNLFQKLGITPVIQHEY